MIQVRVASFLAAVLFVIFASHALAQLPGYPAPRYPQIPRITSVDELMPYVRHLVERAGTGVMRPGYGVRGGEKVLLALGGYGDSDTDPLVIEALVRGFREKGCSVDVVLFQSPRDPNNLWSPDANSEVSADWLLPTPPRPAGDIRPWIQEAAKHYDLVPGIDALTNGRRMMWPTRELLASPAVIYPEELLYTIDRKGWELVRQADKVRLSDPEGTDLTFTYWPEYWEVVEGTHSHIKTKGGGPGTLRGEGYVYGIPGASEHPLIPGHLMGVPEGLIIEKSDAEGVAAATQSHRGFFPRVVLTVSKQKVVKVEGGGLYGERWRAFNAKYDQKIQYPLYPRAGHSYWMEAAIGIHPKIARAHNLVESVAVRGASSYERMRSGIIHLGFGNILSENSAWAQQNNLPSGHFHLHINHSTYEVQLRDGRKVKLIDKGHLTVLDDPEVRRLAARFGDPDQLLREDWIPAVPGINVAGDYATEYAKDPIAWIRQEQRKAYAYIIDFKPYR